MPDDGFGEAMRPADESNFPARGFTVRELYRGTFGTLTGALRVHIAIPAAIWLAFGLALTIATEILAPGMLFTSSTDGTELSGTAIVTTIAVWVAATYVVGALLAAVFSHAAAVQMSGGKPHFRESLRASVSRIPSLLMLCALATAAVLLAMTPAVLLSMWANYANDATVAWLAWIFIVFGIIAIWSMCVRFALCVPVVLTDRNPGSIGALRRSFALTGRRFWKYSGLFLIVSITAVIAWFVLQLGITVLAQFLSEASGYDWDSVAPIIEFVNDCWELLIVQPALSIAAALIFVDAERPEPSAPIDNAGQT